MAPFLTKMTMTLSLRNPLVVCLWSRVQPIVISIGTLLTRGWKEAVLLSRYENRMTSSKAADHFRLCIIPPIMVSIDQDDFSRSENKDFVSCFLSPFSRYRTPPPHPRRDENVILKPQCTRILHDDASFSKIFSQRSYRIAIRLQNSCKTTIHFKVASFFQSN